MLIPKTEEQRTEMIARLVYLLSGLRYFTREWEDRMPKKLMEKDEMLIKTEIRSDEFLKNIGAIEHQGVKDLIAQLTIKE
jgi:hypothetical protein